MSVDLPSKFVGCMLGSALGDAIGELAFRFLDKDRLLEGIERAEELRYTDDTAMAIGLAQSLVEKGDIEQEHLGRTFQKNYEAEPWRGYASGPPTIFSIVRKRKILYIQAARELFGGRGSLGNGAAMRIAPLGIFFYGKKELLTKARLSAEVTHAHPVGMDGAAIMALAIAKAVELDPTDTFIQYDFINELEKACETQEIRKKISYLKELIKDKVSDEQSAQKLGRSVAMHESMPFAVYSFIRYPSSYEECLMCAILNGGDRDTLGAMAGAISGAYLGIDAIPPKWISKLENREYIEGLALELYKRRYEL